MSGLRICFYHVPRDQMSVCLFCVLDAFPVHMTFVFLSFGLFGFALTYAYVALDHTCK